MTTTSARRGARRLVLVFILPVALATGVSHAEEDHAAVSVDLGIPRLDEFSGAYVIVKGAPKVESHKKFKATAATMSDMMIEKLNMAGVFEAVSAGVPEQASATDLGITLLVFTFRYVGWGRWAAGNMAGKAKLGILVTLTSGKTGGTVAEFPLWSTSELFHGVLGATTAKQTARATDEIVQAIVRQRRPQ